MIEGNDSVIKMVKKPPLIIDMQSDCFEICSH